MKIEISKLPHGAIPFHGIGDKQVADIVMKLNENILSLKRQLEVAQRALIELQRKR